MTKLTLSEKLAKIFPIVCGFWQNYQKDGEQQGYEDAGYLNDCVLALCLFFGLTDDDSYYDHTIKIDAGFVNKWCDVISEDWATLKSVEKAYSIAIECAIEDAEQLLRGGDDSGEDDDSWMNDKESNVDDTFTIN